MNRPTSFSLMAALVLVPVSATAGDDLHPLLVTYTPPANVGGEPTFSEEPASVKGVEGGTILIRGRGDLQGVKATLGSDTLYAEPDEIGFRVVIEMPAKSAEVYVYDGMEDHFITLEPVRDTLNLKSGKALGRTGSP